MGHIQQQTGTIGGEGDQKGVRRTVACVDRARRVGLYEPYGQFTPRQNYH